MPSAATVEQYLAGLPEDRRTALQAVRKVILENLDADLEEGMQHGMIGYFVPHRVHPAGYPCDPKQPLGYACLGSQKNHMALYLMCAYGHEGERAWLVDAWKRSGKKLDMGKACIRFRKLDELPLDVIGEAFRRVPAKAYVAFVQAALARPRPKPAAKAAVPKKPPAGKR